MSENLDMCAGECSRDAIDESAYWACLADCEEVERQSQMAGCTVVPTDVLGRIGLALWGLMEDDGWTDDLLGLEPGDRLQIPGAMTGRID